MTAGRRSPLTTLHGVRRLSVVVAALVGVALFGTGVQGLAQIDGRLSDAAERPVVHEVELRQEIPPAGDCPWRDRREPPDELRRL